jgi:dTDP-4-dehydrorhamnose 3,5-epimerase-like enzyme
VPSIINENAKNALFYYALKFMNCAPRVINYICVSDKENRSLFTPTPRLKGVAHTFRVINEDSTVITKTAADYRLEGESARRRFQRAVDKLLPVF